MIRNQERALNALRPYSVERGIQPQAYVSLLMRTGNTQVICAVSVEKRVPPFLEDSGQGWITAEYGMLPGATSTRNRRETGSRSGRSMEIQRLIGRCLRMMVDLRVLEYYTLRVDCDVLNADGGTRTAAITGAALAVRDTIIKMTDDGLLEESVDILPVGAISVGIVDGQVMLDLDYQEDSQADADGNFVMAGDDRWIEIQTTAESEPIHDEQFKQMRIYARDGIRELLKLWQTDF